MTVTAESRLETLEKEFESWLVLIYLHLFVDRKNDSPHNKTCSKWQGYIWATHLVSTGPCRLWFSPVKFTRTLYQKIRLILRNHSLNSEASVTSSKKMLLHLSVIDFFIYCPPSIRRDVHLAWCAVSQVVASASALFLEDQENMASAQNCDWADLMGSDYLLGMVGLGEGFGWFFHGLTWL